MPKYKAKARGYTLPQPEWFKTLCLIGVLFFFAAALFLGYECWLLQNIGIDEKLIIPAIMGLASLISSIKIWIYFTNIPDRR